MNMIYEPYSRLAELYDAEEWGKFSLRYVTLIEDLSKKFTLYPKKILDISCSTGSLVKELSRDFNVRGSDLSKAMIEIAKRNHPECIFYVSDMAELALEERFDLILSPFDSINYLVEEVRLERAFGNIRTLLADRGWILFDFNSDRLFEEKHRGSYERKSGDVCFTQTCEYDKEKQIARTIFDFPPDSKEVHIQRALSLGDIQELLNKTGFRMHYSVDMFTNADATEESYKVLVLAEKT
jgi:hypothetical protein